MSEQQGIIVDSKKENNTDIIFPKPEKYIRDLKEKGYLNYADAYERVLHIATLIQEAGGQALLVGGSVRDYFMNKLAKDFDLEIYGLGPNVIGEIVAQVGNVSEVGKAFGILKIFLDNGIDIDVSLPRVDSKNGNGHKGFDVKCDPNMSIEDAARRRDFTMNALAANPITGELYDYFGGVDDIKNRILRITDSERFRDDPLRALRAMQFIGRFGMSVDKDSISVIREIATQLKELPKERLGEEWKKLLLKSDKPSLGLAAASVFGILENLHNELAIMELTPQEPQWHPEGDAWVHTMMVVDEAAKIVQKENLDSKSATIVMFGALCHDLGKPIVTEYAEDGRFRSLGHESAGAEPTKRFLGTLGIDRLSQQKIINIVSEHLAPTVFYVEEVIKGNKISDGAIRRLAKRIYPATIQELVMIAQADHLGRGKFDLEAKAQLLLPDDNFPAREWLLKRARTLEIEDSRPANLTRGREWLLLGFGPGGPHIGQLIRLSNELRDEKEFTREMVFSLIEKAKKYDEAIYLMEEALN